MATGWSREIARRITDAGRGGEPFALTAHWVMLHSGEPGATGTDNVMNGGARVLIEMAEPVEPASGPWYSLSDTAGEYHDWQGGSTPPTHASSWSAEVGGIFQVSGLTNITSESVPEPGGTFVLPPGAVILAEGAAD